MKTLTNVQNGNAVTQRNAFIAIAALLVIAAVIAKVFFHVDFSQLNNR